MFVLVLYAWSHRLRPRSQECVLHSHPHSHWNTGCPRARRVVGVLPSSAFLSLLVVGVHEDGLYAHLDLVPQRNKSCWKKSQKKIDQCGETNAEKQGLSLPLGFVTRPSSSSSCPSAVVGLKEK